MKILKKILTVFLFLIIFQTNFLYAAESKRIRVGLLPPNDIYTSFELNFDGAHVLKTKGSNSPCYTFDNEGHYIVKRLSGSYELSVDTKSDISGFDLKAYPGAVPLITGEGIRLMNPDIATKPGEKKWNNSVIEKITAGCAYTGEKISFALANSYAIAESKDKSPFKVYYYPYRGGISFYSGKENGIFPINDIEIEDYLKGVVAKEMPASWSIEALKAQAVCARTYALGSLGRFSNNDYDLAPTTVSQVYGGVGAEHENSNRAILETKGEELFYGNTRVQAFFHASNGGYCSASEDVFLNALPYFKPKIDPYTQKVVEPWQKTLSTSALSKLAISEGTDIGEALYISNLKINPSRRVETVDIVGTKGSITVKASKLRYEFGLNSLYFNIVDSKTSQNSTLKAITDNGIIDIKKNEVFVILGNGKIIPVSNFKIMSIGGTETKNFSAGSGKGLTIEGYGWGHGLGMSQWGAKVMAEQGFTYDKILSFYYEGSQIRK